MLLSWNKLKYEIPKIRSIIIKHSHSIAVIWNDGFLKLGKPMDLWIFFWRISRAFFKNIVVLRPLGLGGWAGSAGGPLKPKWWDGFGAIFCPTYLPSGKLSHNYGKSPFSMGKSTISMIIFNSYVSHYQRVTTTSDLEDGTMIFFLCCNICWFWDSTEGFVWKWGAKIPMWKSPVSLLK